MHAQEDHPEAKNNSTDAKTDSLSEKIMMDHTSTMNVLLTRLVEVHGGKSTTFTNVSLFNFRF
jgi:hypothetical protein